jgi:tRNA(Ile2) C34 agmatinyltransferase TiaS
MILLIWIVCAIGAAVIGSMKGRLVEGFFAGLLLGVLGLVFIVFRKAKEKCPECDKWIEPNARKCRHCGARFVMSVAR